MVSQIIGSFDLVMTFDEEFVGEKELESLLKKIRDDVNDKYGNIVDLFEPSGVVDSDMAQLEAIVSTAHQRFIREHHPTALLHAYLKESELNQFYDITRRIKGRQWK